MSLIGIDPVDHVLLECLLRHVLSRLGVAKDAHRDAPDDPLEPAHERDGQVGVSRAKTGKQHLIG